MKNYSFFSKLLHKQFLSKGELTNLFINKILSKAYNLQSDESSNIFITGLARAGTTALLESLDSTNKFASFRYKYMPFILSPKLSYFYSRYLNNADTKKVERMHADGLEIGPDSPECLDEPFWIHTIYKNHGFDNRLQPHSIKTNILNSYAYLLNSFSSIEKKSGMIVKNNNSHLRILSLAGFFKNSKFLIVFRSPIAHAKSLLSLHKRLIKIQKDDGYVLEYMNLLGHWEFGKGVKPFIYNEKQDDIYSYKNTSINYWLKQWIYTYEWILEIHTKNNLGNLRLVCYEDLCNDDNYKSNLFESILINPNEISFNYRIGKSNKDNSSYDIDKKDIDYANYIYNILRENSLNQ